jgi:hypothetical protein
MKKGRDGIAAKRRKKRKKKPGGGRAEFFALPYFFTPFAPFRLRQAYGATGFCGYA